VVATTSYIPFLLTGAESYVTEIYKLEKKKPWGEISADVIWGKKYEKVKEKNGENSKEKRRKRKKIENAK
jgi:hypothetical protein